jgi:hypothetical protein
MVVASYCKPALKSHPAYAANTTMLRSSGVMILEGDDSILPEHDHFNWNAVTSAIKRPRISGL